MLKESIVIPTFDEPSSNFSSLNHNSSLCTVTRFTFFIPMLLCIKYQDHCHVANDWTVIRSKLMEVNKQLYCEQLMLLCSCRLNSDLPDLLQNCDYIINVLPSTPDTTGDMLKHCAQKQPVFINIGRGTVIKEKDLINALSRGWLSAAILDVFETGPLPPSSVLWTMPQVKYTFLMKWLMSPIDSGDTWNMGFLKMGFLKKECCSYSTPRKPLLCIPIATEWDTERNNTLADNFWLYVDHH